MMLSCQVVLWKCCHQEVCQMTWRGGRLFSSHHSLFYKLIASGERNRGMIQHWANFWQVSAMFVWNRTIVGGQKMN